MRGAAGTGQTYVMSVLGPVPVAELGITLSHEHIFNDVRSWHQPTTSLGLDPDEFAGSPVDEPLVWDLRHDPFGNLDNCRLEDMDMAIEEVSRYADFGGTTILDATGQSIGRALPALAQVSRETGVTIVAGAGQYLDRSMDDTVRGLSVEQHEELLTRDIEHGQDGYRPGFIGEIGVSADFTVAERRSLEAAMRVQARTGLPIQVHLPGWFRLGHEVLDIGERAGADLNAVLLCHMNPSFDDPDYQTSLAARGARLGFDMVGMEVFYADQGVQCPSDEQTARAIVALAEAGWLEHVHISHDIFLKSLLRRHGGPGYAHILQYYVPRLRRHGFGDPEIDQLLIVNPRSLFDPRSPSTLLEERP